MRAFLLFVVGALALAASVNHAQQVQDPNDGWFYNKSSCTIVMYHDRQPDLKFTIPPGYMIPNDFATNFGPIAMDVTC